MGLILDCSTTLSNCCNSFALASILNITRKVFNLIQLIAPIILILMTTIQFTQLSVNPELKDGFRRILNKIVAAFIIFLLPILVDAVMGVLPDSVSISTCWNSARGVVEHFNPDAWYIPLDDDNDYSNLVVNSGSIFDRIDTNMNKDIDNNSKPTTKTNVVKKEDIVKYAKSFYGKGYKYGGEWDGSPSYTKTDCSGFIKGVYAHFGISLPHGSYLFVNSENTYKISASEARAGDIVVYEGRHSAMLTGNGNEIIHNTSAHGITTYSNYRYRKVREILRVKGVE